MVHVETVGYNQDGTVVCVFRRKVLVAKNATSRRGEVSSRLDRRLARWTEDRKLREPLLPGWEHVCVPGGAWGTLLGSRG